MLQGQQHHHVDSDINLLKAKFHESKKQHIQKIQQDDMEIKNLNSRIEALSKNTSKENIYDSLKLQKKEELNAQKEKYDKMLESLQFELSKIQTEQKYNKKKYDTMIEVQRKSEISKARYKEQLKRYEEQRVN